MRVEMLETKDVAPDGIEVVILEEGRVLELRDDLAERLIDQGRAKQVKDTAKLTEGAPEPAEPPATIQGEPEEPSEQPTETPAAETPAETPAAETPAETPAAETGTGAKPEPESKPATANELVKAHDRDELNAMATIAGVQEPDKLKTKKDVAEAIVAARG